MNRQKLTELLQHPERINSRDASLLTEMAEQYPYATVIQILLAKSKQQQTEARQSLATAALYSPNRSILRQVMENTLPSLFSAEEVNSTDVVAEASPVTPAPETSAPEEATAAQPEQKDPEEKAKPQEEAARDKADVFEELQRNLRRLREERSKWHHQDKPQSSDEQAVHSGTSATDESSTSQVPGPVPVTLQQIIEEHQEQPLENPRIRAQRNLINSFLENGGNLQRRQLQQQANDEVTDLTQNANYTPQDLATETLAKIMERQGKIEKALDIYQKLSLKYPQKSAYFANCIERLKKDL